MNIVMQICGMLVVAFLFVLYRSHRTLHLPSENVFRIFLIIVFADLLLDALSVVAIHYGKLDVIPEWLMQVSCKSYIISLMWVGCINFVYVSIDLDSTRERHIRTQIIMAAVTALESVLVAFLPLNAVEEGMTVYTEGPAVYAVYAFTIIDIISTLCIALYIRKKKSGRRGFAVIITTCLWILAAIIQFVNNELLLVGFSEAVGVMILYIVMENPDANLDKRLGCFNSYAFREYINLRNDLKKDFCLLDVSIANVRILEEQGLNVDVATQKAIRKLSSHRDILVFKNDLANLVAVADNEEAISRISSELLNMISAYKLANNTVIVFTLSNGIQFGNADELLKFMSYVRGNSATRLSTIMNVSDEMIRSYRNIGVVEKEIDTALDEDRVEVFMQPIYSNDEEKVVSAEALVRIRKTDGTLLSPGLFIPIAEATGQVKALGERVLEKVCQFLKETNATALGLRCVDVNLSAVQCDDNSMAGNLCRIVEKYGVDSSLINFEITETAVSNAKDTLLENMNALVSKGFSFALDDFGKGESNLIYIVKMPVRFIKLDIDMSKAYFESPKAKHVVASITDMARKLGLQVVAEGIETQNEAEGIRAEGVHFIQGYYYSRPLPLDEFLSYLAKNVHQPSETTDEASRHDTEPDKNSYDLSTLKGQKVLLVEDNELNREIAKELLEEYGFEVDTAEDGTIAVEKLEKASAGDYDFILMDIKMPIMDGFEATRRIRMLKNKAVANLPIVALTAYANEETLQLGAVSSIDDIASKPIEVPKIMKMIIRIEAERAASLSVHS